MRSLTEVLLACAQKQKNPERDRNGKFVSRKKQNRFATIQSLRIIKQNAKGVKASEQEKKEEPQQ